MSGRRPEVSAHSIAAASRALGLDQPEVTSLEGGIANRTYRLREGRRDFVLRIAGDAAAGLGASSRSEIAMQALAAGAGLAPPVVLADPGLGYVVSEFTAGLAPSAEAMRDCPTLGRLGAWFARLHALDPPAGLAAVDFGERAAACLARVAARDPGRSVWQLQRELARRRGKLPSPARLAPCHHDPHRRNFLDDGTQIRAIDWEYAGPGDPAADLAACAGYHALDATGIEALFEGYGGAGAALRARVAALAWIFDCLWYAWNAVAARSGLAPDAGEQRRLAGRLGL